MFSDIQLRIATDILVSAGEVFLASLVVPFFVEKFNSAAFISGMVLMGCVWISALFIGKNIRS